MPERLRHRVVNFYSKPGFLFMIVRPHLHWFRLLFVWRGSVLPCLIYRLMLVLAVSVVSVLCRDWWMSQHAASALSIPPFTLMGVALAIFLGFRNTVSYDRYWEARKQWGSLLIAARSLTRQVASLCPQDVPLQHRVVRVVAAFMYAQKHQLRRTDPKADLATRLDAETLAEVSGARFVPSMLLLVMGRMLAQTQQAGGLSEWQWQAMDRNLHLMTEAGGACERIANTPIPYTYRVLMNRTVMTYCLLLPIGLSASIGWLTPLVATFIAYTFLAVDVIGEQIEEPFGTEPNDLALDAMCHAIEVSVCEMVGAPVVGEAPLVKNWVAH
jgi:putative membrane protein